MNDPLEQALSSLDLRVRLQRAVSWSLWACLLGLSFAVLLGAVNRGLALNYAWVMLALGIIAAIILSGLTMAAAGLLPISRRRLAALADRKLGLHERLLTATEIRRGSLSGSLAAAQIADALAHARNLRAGQILPWKLPWKRLAALAALLAVSTFVAAGGSSGDTRVRQRELNERSIAIARQQLAQAQQDAAASGGADTPVSEGLRQALAEAQRALAAANGQPDSALAALAEAEQRLRSMVDAAAAGDKQALSALSELLSGTEAGRNAGDALSRGDAAAIAKALSELARSNLTPQQQNDLTSQLQRAAEQATAAGDSALAEAIHRLAEAQQSGDAQARQQAADRLAQVAGSQSQQVADQAQLQRALAAIAGQRDAIARAARATEPGQGAGPPQAGAGPGSATAPGAGNARSGQSGSAGSAGAPGAGSQGGSGSGAGTGPGSAPGPGTVYAPGSNPNGPQNVLSPGSSGPSQSLPVAPSEGVPGSGNATVPYQQVLRDYQNRAGDALQSQYIPPNLKGYVKDYFSSLEAGAR